MQTKLNLQGLKMKKLLYFTKRQRNLLDELKSVTGNSNSQIVRDAMIAYAEKLDIKCSKV